jgi:hypothetical protein
MNENNINAITPALLFMAEKYRVIGTIANRFDDGAIIDAASTAEQAARRVAMTISHDGITTREDAATVNTAIEGWLDNMNRQLQTLAGRGQMQDAALVEARIRELYAAQQAVELTARGLASEAEAA